MQYLLILVLILTGGYWYWTTTPDFAIHEIVNSMKSCDLEKFEKYVDLDSVSDHMVDDFLTEPMGKILGQNLLGKAIWAGAVSFVKPQLTRSIKSELINLVESGDFHKQQETSGCSPQFSLAKADQNLGFRAHAFNGIKSLHVTGKIAQGEVVLHNSRYDKDLCLEVKLRNRNGAWHLSQLSNFPSFCGELAELEAERAKESEISSDGQKHPPDTETDTEEDTEANEPKPTTQL